MIKIDCPIRDEIEIPDLTETEHKRLFPPHVPADPERWHRLALEHGALGIRAEANEHGPERTRLKQEQRAVRKQLVDEMFRIHEHGFYDWPDGLSLLFDPDGRVGNGTWQADMDEQIGVKIFFRSPASD